MRYIDWARKAFSNKYLKRTGFGIFVCLAFVVLSFVSYAIYDNVMYGDPATDTPADYEEKDYSSCTVLGINLHGVLLTYVPEGNEDDPLSEKDVVGSEEIVSAIRAADEDDNIKGYLIEVDSPGGLPVAGEEIANALKASNKPSAVVIRSTGASSAYWAASGASRIFASKSSDVGSIGVTMSYLEDISKDKKYVQLSSGKYKDAGNPEKPLTEEEKELLMRDIKIVHENFIENVAINRNIPIEKIRAIADGSSVLGEKAKSLKLIDEIGSWVEAEKYLEQQIGEKPVVCW